MCEKFQFLCTMWCAQILQKNINVTALHIQNEINSLLLLNLKQKCLVHHPLWYCWRPCWMNTGSPTNSSLSTYLLCSNLSSSLSLQSFLFYFRLLPEIPSSISFSVTSSGIYVKWSPSFSYFFSCQISRYKMEKKMKVLNFFPQNSSSTC